MEAVGIGRENPVKTKLGYFFAGDRPAP